MTKSPARPLLRRARWAANARRLGPQIRFREIIMELFCGDSCSVSGRTVFVLTARMRPHATTGEAQSKSRLLFEGKSFCAIKGSDGCPIHNETDDEFRIKVCTLFLMNSLPETKDEKQNHLRNGLPIRFEPPPPDGAESAESKTRRTLQASWLNQLAGNKERVIAVPIEIRHAIIEGPIKLS